MKIIIRPRHLFVCILAVLTALPLVGTVAQGATIEVLETFDFPGTGISTLPQKISDTGVIVGIYVDADGVNRGFYRSRNGKFIKSFVEPNDTGNLTQGWGINSSRTIAGVYLNGDDITTHGYFLSRGFFTEFDFAEASDTLILGLNNAGDFAGLVIFNDGTLPAFVCLSGVITTFEVPGALATLAYGLNSSNQIVGTYNDSAGVVHGYTRESDGSLTFPIDPADSAQTILYQRNDSGWVVGRYTDSSGVTHGLFFTAPADLMTFDFPGSTFTSLNGINQGGFISGRYVDGAGIAHGFLAKLNPAATAEPNHNNLPLTPVKPVRPAPETNAIGVPAL